jgi:hypothetical protein
LENKLLSEKRIMRIRNKRWEMTLTAVAAMAHLLIYTAVFSSLISRSVFYSLKTKSSGFLILANKVLLPTAQMTALPYPHIILLSV